SSLLLCPPSSTLFPYTTLFRSRRGSPRHSRRVRGVHLHLVDRRHAARAGAGQVVAGWGALSARTWTAGQLAGGKRAPASDHLPRSEEHTSELQSRGHLVCRLLL